MFGRFSRIYAGSQRIGKIEQGATPLWAWIAVPVQVSAIPYQKIVVGEPFFYALADHFLSADTFALAPGSPALAAGMTLAPNGDLKGPATAPATSLVPVIRATNTASGLFVDKPFNLAALQRPAAMPAPTLLRTGPNVVEVTRPAYPANTPPIVGADLMFGPTSPVTEANGTVWLNAITGTKASIPMSEDEDTYVLLRSLIAWGDGTFLAAADFSTEASLAAIVAPAPPSFTQQPSLGAVAFRVGDTVTLDLGTAVVAATLAIEAFTLDGVDLKPELSGLSWNSSGHSPGTLSLQVRATNSGGSVLSNVVTASLASAAAWDVAGGQNAILINAMPPVVAPKAPVATGGVNAITITG